MRRHFAILLLILLTALPAPGAEGKPDEQDALFPVCVKGKWGYIDRKGEMVIEPQWIEAYTFKDGYALVKVWADEEPGSYSPSFASGPRSLTWGLWGIIDYKGNYVIEPVFDWIRGPENGVFAGRAENSWDYYDLSGNRLTEEKFKSAWAMQGGMYKVDTASSADQFLDGDFNPVIEVNGYNYVGYFHFGRAKVRKGIVGPYGQIDKTGNLVLPCEWDYVNQVSEDYTMVRMGDTRFLLDADGNKVSTLPDVGFNGMSEGLIRTDGFSSPDCGFIDVNGNWAVEPQYYLATLFQNGRSIAVDKDGRMLVIDTKGDLVADTGIRHRYACCIPADPENGLVRLHFADSLGILDPEFNLTIAEGLGTMRPFNEGVSLFRRYNTRTGGAVDPQGEILFETDFIEFKEDFADGIAVTGRRVDNHSSGSVLLDREGTVTSLPFTTSIRQFAEGLAGYWDSTLNLYGYLDTRGNVVIQPQFEMAGAFVDGLAPVTIGTAAGFIDKKGTFAIPAEFEETRKFSDGMAAVMKGEKWGFVSRKGIRLIDCRFADVGPFSEGLARATEDGEKWGFINRMGRWVVKPEYDEAGDYHEGFAAVHIAPEDAEGRKLKHEPNYGWKSGLIDRRGNEITGWRFDWIGDFGSGFAPVHIHDEWGGYFEYIDATGEVVTDLHAQNARPFSEGYAIVAFSHANGWVDLDGNVIWEPTW